MTPATLVNLITNDSGLRVFCDGCDRCVDPDVDGLVSRYGSGMELPEIGRWARCGVCGGKGGRVQVVAMRA